MVITYGVLWFLQLGSELRRILGCRFQAHMTPINNGSGGIDAYQILPGVTKGAGEGVNLSFPKSAGNQL